LQAKQLASSDGTLRVEIVLENQGEQAFRVSRTLGYRGFFELEIQDQEGSTLEYPIEADYFDYVIRGECVAPGERTVIVVDLCGWATMLDGLSEPTEDLAFRVTSGSRLRVTYSEGYFLNRCRAIDGKLESDWIPLNGFC
jgi:hypothetical protein